MSELVINSKEYPSLSLATETNIGLGNLKVW